MTWRVNTIGLQLDDTLHEHAMLVYVVSCNWSRLILKIERLSIFQGRKVIDDFPIFTVTIVRGKLRMKDTFADGYLMQFSSTVIVDSYINFCLNSKTIWDPN